MVTGIGIDLIETARVEEKIAKDSGFREYVFSENEIAYCESKTNRFEHFAARFAAKEALLKALGTGFPGGLVLNEIDVTSDYGEVKKKKKTYSVLKSIAHWLFYH